MPSIQLSLDQNILRLRLVDKATKVQLVQDTTEQLKQLIAAEDIPEDIFLGVNGPSPLIVAYAIADQLCSHCGAVGVYDLKLPGYVVVTSSTADYQVGQVVDLQDGVENPLKIALCGPPHTGKSCLRFGLKEALMEPYRRQTGPYPYIYEACPDGEGSWFPETIQNYEEIAKALKAKYKSAFTSAFVHQTSKVIQKIREPLTLVDIGGVISQENKTIIRGATHAIILWRDQFQEVEDSYYSSLEDWRTFCNEQGLNVIGEIKSDYDALADVVDQESPLVIGTIHHLDRGCKVNNRPIVQALSHKIIELCNAA